MAAMTGKQVIDQVRKDIDDIGSTQTWSDADFMIPFLNLEVRNIVKDHPEALIASGGTLITVADITAVSGTVSIDDAWKSRLVDGIKRRLYQTKGSGRENRILAKMHQENIDREL